MRFIVFILTFWVAAFEMLSPAMALDAIMGRLISIDHQAGTLLLKPLGKDEPITVHFSPEQLPEFIKEGTIVRVWGSYDGQMAESFQATSIQRSLQGAEHDPTGVRRRIGRGGMGRGGGHGGRGGGGGRR